MRLLEAPQTWIAVAVVLLVIAIVLLVLARRSRRTASRTADATQPTQPTEPARADRTPAPAARASYDPEVDDADPATGPVDLRAVTTGRRPAETAPPAPPTSAAPSDAPPAIDQRAADQPAADQPAKDRLLAALLADPQAAVRAVSSIDAANGSGPPGESVASLLRAGMSPAQVASLCRVRESALAEIVARDLGLLTTQHATDDAGTAWPSLAGTAGSTTPTTG